MLILTRTSSSRDGTLGTLRTEDNSLLLHTIEPPWRGNRPNISCIPSGVYFVHPHTSPAHGRCLLVQGGTVAATTEDRLRTQGARYAVHVHSANRAHELLGCIAPGTEHGMDPDGTPYVAHSRDAMAMLLALFGSDDDVAAMLIGWE